MAESPYNRRKFGLPKPTKDPRKTTCGICQSLKVELLGDDTALVCPHCDKGCKVSLAVSCGICEAGMKDLPDPEVRKWTGELNGE